MSKHIFFWVMIFFSLKGFSQKKIVLHFEHRANGKQIVLRDSLYSNVFGENYSISKLKYYVSNIHFTTSGTSRVDKTVYLMDASKKNRVVQSAVGKITGISFMLGVDSILNCSGSQAGALDPLNDMFWTWNNGYVMFKLEGKSASSAADNNRIEQHIGGYKGMYKTMRQIFLPLQHNCFLDKNDLTIVLNIDEFWKGTNEIRIAENPVITGPGPLALKAANNFTKMFSIQIEE